MQPVKPKIGATLSASASSASASSAIVPFVPTTAHALPVLFDLEPDFVEGEVIEIATESGWLITTPSVPFLETDVLEMWLRIKPSAATRLNYRSDIEQFFDSQFALKPSPQNVLRFLGLGQRQMKEVVEDFEVRQREAGRAPGTIKRRIAAVRSLVIYAGGLELCRVDGRFLKDSIKVETYRDTRGIDRAKMRKLFAQPGKKHGKNSVRALRDLALLTLLYENALRRAEVCSLNVGDFDFEGRCLWIVGKGRSQRELIDLTGYATGAIQAYLNAGGHAGDKGPLFRNFSRNPEFAGERLSGDGLHDLMKNYGEQIGVAGFRPHKMRHAAITHAFDAGMSADEVRKLSRHKKFDTLFLYRDNSQKLQGKVSNVLSGLHR